LPEEEAYAGRWVKGETVMRRVSPEGDNLSITVRKEVRSVLRRGHAHVNFEDAVLDFPQEQRGIVLQGLPYSAWQVLEHMRITQRSHLDFANHYFSDQPQLLKQLRWPRDYWIKQTIPPSDDAWGISVKGVIDDREAFLKLLDDATDLTLTKPPAPGKHRNLLRIALQIADHNAYHIGQLVMIRRLLGVWKT
jgi:hypothetical protein